MYLVTCISLFFLGSIGIFLSRKNFIFMLMSLELMLLSVNMLFFFFSLYLDNLFGFVFIFYILTVAAAETAIGLSLIVVYSNLYKSTSI
jgi:NADH-quinone oxidoreductase subunit K